MRQKALSTCHNDSQAQRFQGDEKALGRHLTGLNLLLQHTESMAAEEKLAAQVHLEPFTHLLLADPASDV